MKPRVLWVEDGARYDLHELAAPVYTSGRYELHIAEDATAAVSKLTHDEYRAVIVDIRLPPGRGPEWIPLWSRANRDKVRAQLGLQLLYAILLPQKAKIPCDPIPWLTADRVAILTVESQSELREHLDTLGISCFTEKRA